MNTGYIFKGHYPTCWLNVLERTSPSSSVLTLFLILNILKGIHYLPSTNQLPSFLYIYTATVCNSAQVSGVPPETTIVLIPAKMSELRAADVEKGLRKRRSTTAIREEDGSRKKVAHATGEKGEETEDIIEMVTTKMREFMEAKHMYKQKARDDGSRVESKARMRPRSVCCACRKTSGVSRNEECLECGHHNCAECLVITQEKTECLFGR